MADDELVAWLTATLDEIERRHGHPYTDPESWCDRAGGWHMEPPAVMARVEAERAIVAAWRAADVEYDAVANRTQDYVIDEDAYDQIEAEVRTRADTLLQAIRGLAYGHRFDAPGYRDDWAPDV